MGHVSGHAAALNPVPGSRRGRAGRPRKGDLGIFAKPEDGHNAGTPASKDRVNSGDRSHAAVCTTVGPVAPRLLDLHGAAAYLGLSKYTVRELEQQGILARVRIPLPDAGEVRKLLFDKQDLDLLVESWKEGGNGESRTEG